MFRSLVIVLLLGMTSAAAALEDTPENRAAQVDRYLMIAPRQSVFDSITTRMANGLPADQREMFITAMSKHLDIGALTQSMRAAMLKTFTADELSALADFYSSPVGKSAMGKMGDYMAELMPAIGTQMESAMRATQEDLMAPPKK